jgi:hypothetical protein
VPGKSYNWEIWWRNKFKDDYKDYTRRMSEEREKEKAEKI